MIYLVCGFLIFLISFVVLMTIAIMMFEIKNKMWGRWWLD